MHQIQFRLGLRLRPRWGSLQRSPDRLAGGEAGCLLPKKHPALCPSGLNTRRFALDTSPSAITISPDLGMLDKTLMTKIDWRYARTICFIQLFMGVTLWQTDERLQNMAQTYRLQKKMCRHPTFRLNNNILVKGRQQVTRKSNTRSINRIYRLLNCQQSVMGKSQIKSHMQNLKSLTKKIAISSLKSQTPITNFNLKSLNLSVKISNHSQIPNTYITAPSNYQNRNVTMAGWHKKQLTVKFTDLKNRQYRPIVFCLLRMKK